MLRPVQGSEVVALGDFAELQPLPGEPWSRLVQVEKLWSEDLGLRSRMLMCCKRLYRPEVGPQHALQGVLGTASAWPDYALICFSSCLLGTEHDGSSSGSTCPHWPRPPSSG